MDAQYSTTSEVVLKVIEEKKRQEILHWLSPVKPVDHHSHARRNRAKDSGKWLFKKPEFQRWIEVEHSSVLWLYGKAGSGKTVLCSTVIDTLLATYPHNPVLYFYCNYKEESRQELKPILRTIYRDLVGLAGARLDSNLEKEYDSWKLRNEFHSGKLSNERSSGLSINRIQELFSAEALKHNLIFLVIDALDECDNDRLELIQYLRNAIAQGIGKTIQVKLLITSRYDSGIQNMLTSGLMYEISPTDISADINLFVKGRLNDMIETGKLLSGHVTMDLQREIIEALNGKAGRTFLWVDFQLSAICEHASVADVRQQLRQLPDNMEETYSRMLAKIDDKPKRTREWAYKALMWIFGAKEPLTPEQLVQATAVEVGSKTINKDNFAPSAQYLVDLCCHTVAIDKNTNTLHFVHFSVQEFLESHPKFQSVQQYLGLACLTVMGIDLENMQSEAERKMIQSFYQYATNRWWHFAKGIEQTSYNLVMTLLRRIPSNQFSFSFPDYLPATWCRSWQWKWKGVMAGDHDTLGTETDLSYYLKCVMAYHDLATTLKYDLNVSRADQSGLAELLMIAIGRESLNTIRILLENGCDVNYHIGNTGTSEAEDKVVHALQAAARVGNRKVVEMLLNAGAEVNAQGGKFGNALQAATWGGKPKVVEMLLNSGASINTQGGEYGNALQAAAWHGHPEIVEMLLNAGAEVNAEGGEFGNALQAVVWGGNPEIVKMLLNAGAEVNAKGGEFGSALQAVVWGGNPEIVKMLLNAGAEVNSQGEYGNALQAAAWRGIPEIVEMLLNAGAGVNSQGGEFGNALQAAAWCGIPEIVEMLLNAGAEVNSQGGEYGNALQAAAADGNLGIVQVLLKAGAKVNAQGGKYGNALQAASHAETICGPDGVWYAQKNLRIVDILLMAGANVNSQGGRYGNALQAAAHAGNVDIVGRLLIAGGDVSAEGGEYGNALRAAVADYQNDDGDVVYKDIAKIVKMLVDGCKGRTYR